MEKTRYTTIHAKDVLNSGRDFVQDGRCTWTAPQWPQDLLREVEIGDVRTQMNTLMLERNREWARPQQSLAGIQQCSEQMEGEG